MRGAVASRTCPWCGKFVFNRRHGGYCSAKCRRAHTMESGRTCRICGEPIPRDGTDVCWYCASAVTEENAAEAASALSPGLLKTRRCHDCGKPCSSYRCRECWAKLRGKGAPLPPPEEDGDFGEPEDEE